jgi:DNA topoisomerase-1
VEAIRGYVHKHYGNEYLPAKPRVYKGKAIAQEAHEAIRPTDVKRTPESLKDRLDSDQFRLYALIWRRAVASQMEAARFDETVVESSAPLAGKHEAVFQARGEIERFPGWLVVYRTAAEEQSAEAMADPTGEEDADELVGLPPLKVGQALNLEHLDTEQQFTKPPARFSEATLVRELEEDGIGRPSTYASIISTIQDRDYVKKQEGRFKPTELGCVVTDLLVQGFQELMEPSYTSGLETELDRIEEGELSFLKAMKNFYGPFEKQLHRAGTDMANLKVGIATDKLCKKCQAPMLKRIGKNGLFLGCSRYPECDHTEEPEQLEEPEDAPECPLCGATPMVLRKGQFGPFWACANYPGCKGIRKADPKGIPVPPDQPLDEKCPTCGKHFVKRFGRYGEFVCCVDYPRCKTVKKEILGVPCPRCGGDLSPRKSRFGKVFYGCTNYPKCDFTAWDKPVPRSCPKCKSKYMVEKVRKPRGKEPVTVLLCPQCAHEEPMG